MTVTPPSDPETDEIAGVTGSASFHCAINVLFELPIVVAKPAARILEPSLQPSNVKPLRVKLVPSFKFTLAPLAATVGAGSVPPVEPFVL